MDNMVLRHLLLVDKKNVTKFNKMEQGLSDNYFVSEDIKSLVTIKRNLGPEIKINTLSTIFNQTQEEIRKPFIDFMGEIGKADNSRQWWSGHIASKNTAATNLFLHTTYLFCVINILKNSKIDVVLILDNIALAKCISIVGRKLGYQTINSFSREKKIFEIINFWFIFSFKSILFFYRIFLAKRNILKHFRPFQFQELGNKKRILIRSWFTESNLQSTIYRDRNFGVLVEWLESKNYEVCILPMFFNITSKMSCVYTYLNKQRLNFLLPERYIGWPDIFKLYRDGCKLFLKNYDFAEINDVNIAPLLNDVLKRQGFDLSLAKLNSSYFFLKYLKKNSVRVDSFCYPFENNAPEKSFLLGCREFYPNSKVIGFQHTAFYETNLAFYNGKIEEKIHPLPDKIVCSGLKYLSLFEESGFPKKILVKGSNLRFNSVNDNQVDRNLNNGRSKIKLLLPLPFSYNLAFDILVKIKELEVKHPNYTLIIRSHPLLSLDVLCDFILSIKLRVDNFANTGKIQDWLKDVFAVITVGASITTLEAITMGVPVIRVIPDNTFHYDALNNDDYPLHPVETPTGISEQIKVIDKILAIDKDCFVEIAKKIHDEYFLKTTEESMNEFL
jgi:surface carbohydrate biosynthesis protein (TIGR04326 family)